LHVATDWQDYAEQALAVLEAVPQLRNTARRLRGASGVASGNEVRAPRPRLGHGVWDLLFTKTENT
jgi:tRNA (guanine-N7-)-methyltransferase